MSKKKENYKITIAVPPKLDMSFRRDALNERLSFGEMLEKYRNAYLEKIEREKQEKKMKKDS
jgi:hypothetical protein